MWPKKKPHWSEHVLFAAKGHRKLWHHFPHNAFLTNATQIEFLFNIRSCIHKLRQPYIFNNCNHHMTGLRYLKRRCIKYLSGTEIRLLPPRAGSSVTPNYLDNSTSSVAPWCSCPAPGSQGDECSEFLGYFSHNVCLRESRPACLCTLFEGLHQQFSFV